MNIKILLTGFTIIILLLVNFNLTLQAQDNDLSRLIENYKNDNRGPYKDIRWFCHNGINLPAKERCPDTTGYQRARLKDEVESIAKNKDIYLTQILMGGDKQKFLNSDNNYSRVKQYLLEKYLFQVDDGWILNKAQYYRGAIQDEDENKWGLEFLTWLLNGKQYNAELFFLFREMTKHIPHGEESNLVTDIRSLSLNLSDRFPSFMNIRTKIHGNLEAKDSLKINAFITDSKNKLKDKDLLDFTKLNRLIREFSTQSLKETITLTKPKKDLSKLYDDLVNIQSSLNANEIDRFSIQASDALSFLKDLINNNSNSKDRLFLMDLSIKLEQLLLSKINAWEVKNLEDHLRKSCYLAQSLNATGHTYDWEFEELLGTYSNIPLEKVSFENLRLIYQTLRKNINWGSGIIITEFGEIIEKWSLFEPKSEGFIDDRIRSSFLLGLGFEAAYLNDIINKKANWKNVFFDFKSSDLSMVNPGIARGKLIFDNANEEKKDPQGIYVFRKPPADLDPIAGVFSISEGNMVSHLQLLSKNLGIPNINITEATFQELKKYEGKEIFMAASPQGGMSIKLAKELSNKELDLFKKKEINEGIITVPIDQIDLDNKRVIPIKELDAKDSGIICGPKAANYARLKKMFPANMVDGFVIPFSVFKDHMDQKIATKNFTYWEFLEECFENVALLKKSGENQDKIDKQTLEYLEELRNYIKVIPIKQSLITDLESQFKSTFGKDLGEVPVFLRSDTNMEDLKDFTGAGLNMTIFNVKLKDKIIQGIRDVWTSPYSERSYKWRQKFLTNPENVFPSILIIPSVYVDYSGVIISKDFVNLNPYALNVAFSQGAGGAVDGQKSESWIMLPRGEEILITPSRDRNYKYIKNDGTIEHAYASLNERLLNDNNIKAIWEMIYEINKSMPKIGMEGPYDIELGFKDDQLWIFQIRPFVENKLANATNYLLEINPVIPKNAYFNLNDNYVQ